jgi:hypothetical protein
MNSKKIVAMSMLIILCFGLVDACILNVKEEYQKDTSIRGTLEIYLEQGELIPSSSKIVFENAGKRNEFDLKDLVTSELIQGDYFCNQKNISGNGLGYGIPEYSENYPSVYFVLDIYSKKSSGGGSKNIVNTPQESLDAEDKKGKENKTNQGNEKDKENKTNQGNEKDKENKIKGSGRAIAEEVGVFSNVLQSFSLFFGVTGSSSLELEKEIKGEVSFGDSFVYVLDKDEKAEIEQGSVKSDVKDLFDDDINLKIHKGEAIVTTTYKGEMYDVGDWRAHGKILEIDLHKTRLSFEEGELNISLVYENEVLVSKTIILGKFEELNAESLNSEEKGILIQKFGENFSIEVSKPEVFNGRVIKNYKLGDYEVKHSYDASANENSLEKEMKNDQIRWLKDIANSLIEKKNLKRKYNPKENVVVGF